MLESSLDLGERDDLGGAATVISGSAAARRAASWSSVRNTVDNPRFTTMAIVSASPMCWLGSDSPGFLMCSAIVRASTNSLGSRDEWFVEHVGPVGKAG